MPVGTLLQGLTNIPPLHFELESDAGWMVAPVAIPCSLAPTSSSNMEHLHPTITYYINTVLNLHTEYHSDQDDLP